MTTTIYLKENWQEGMNELLDMYYAWKQRQLALVAASADTDNIVCSSVTNSVAENEPAVRMGHEWDAK
jgi:hypothetical protein